jgi:hypothetical protein
VGELLRDLGRVGVEQADGPDGEGAAQQLHEANIGTDAGAMPAKVSDSVRATLIAGLAKLVLLVNQYAAVM